MITKTLSRHQARWSEYLSRFNFKIVYQPENMNTKTDTLTRRSGDLSPNEDERVFQQSGVVLKPDHFLEAHTSNITFDPTLDEPISELRLSEIYDNDFQYLESKVIQSTPLSPSEQAEVSSNKNDLVNPDEFWKLAYINLENPMHEVITLLLQNHRRHLIFCKLRLSMADCQLKHGQLFYRN